jgi:hypothetical protein
MWYELQDSDCLYNLDRVALIKQDGPVIYLYLDGIKTTNKMDENVFIINYYTTEEA